MPFLETNGCRFFYQQKGEGPDVVLLHGFTSSVAIWVFTGSIDQLAENYRVTAFDLRGHGGSEVSKTGYRSDQMVEDFRAIHEALELEPCAVVGHSFGGVIGIHASILYPELIKGVVFSDTYFPGLKHLEPEMGQAEPWADLREQMKKCGIEIGETVNFPKLFEHVRSMTEEQKTTLTRNMGAFSANWITTLGALAESTAGVEVFEESGLTADLIANVKCPVVALYDEFSPFHTTREFFEDKLDNIESAIVPEAKHLAPLQSTDAFLELVEKGLEKIHHSGSSQICL